MIDSISVNSLTEPLVEGLLRDASQLRVGIRQDSRGYTLVDAGIEHAGSLEAGVRIAEICMAGLGRVRLVSRSRFARWTWHVEVATSMPVLSCLGSQYAGWSLAADGNENFFALGSGPARALAVKEPLFGELGYWDRFERTCLVLEADRNPPSAIAEKIARDCGIATSGLTLILTPTGSLAGTVQIAARVVEVALHKAHSLGFDLSRIVDGAGVTPLPPPTHDPLTAMGRTNDTILFGGDVQLFVTGPDADARALAAALPSSASRDYGRPFAEVFKDYEYDFFKVDPLLFSPARVAVTALESGRTHVAGHLDEALLERSFT